MNMTVNGNQVRYCTSCGWHHDDVEIKTENNQTYFICLLSKAKIIIGGN